MSILFDPVTIDDPHAFCGVFLSQDSYAELLTLADKSFSLGLRSTQSVLPLSVHSYMLISRVGSRNVSGIKQDIWRHAGVRASVTITDLAYNQIQGVIIALVHLKNNFTCNPTPHIIIAKKDHFTNATASDTLTQGSYHKVPLATPVKLRGRIGVMIDSQEEIIRPPVLSIPRVSFRENLTSETPAEMPAPAPVPGPLPVPLAVFVPVSTVIPDHRSQIKAEAPPEPVAPTVSPKSTDMVITIKTNPNETATGEIWKGCQVFVGKRGAKYIYAEPGRKRYLPKDELNKPVYRVNLFP